MEKAIQEKIQRLQLIEESLHNYLGQKQQLQAQLMEIESGIDALKGADKSYKIIGNIMVEKPAADLMKGLDEKAERVKLRVAALERQEEKLKQQAESLQQEIMKGMGDAHGDIQ